MKSFILLTIFIFTGIQFAEAKNEFIPLIEKAHMKKDFLSKKAVSFDIEIFFGDKQMFKGEITTLTNSGKTRIDMADGVSLIYDGKEVYQTPPDVEDAMMRFHMFTWSYFFLLPYKLSDPGTVWKDYENNKLAEKTFNTQKLTFKDDIGDSPDDWYIVYADPETNVIKYSAYIVTYFASKEEAEKDPHAIEYSGYKEFDGIPISTEWIFWGWREDKGLTEKIGNANLTNIKFVDVEDEIFSKPENSKIIE